MQNIEYMHIANVKRILLFELTVPFEFYTTFIERHKDKLLKYEALINSLRNSGFIPELICLVVGSRGHITKGNKGRLLHIMNLIKVGKQHKTILANIS